ncbi:MULTISPECIES: hypothetical protein [unclassified Paenibacillus]|uniref:hypothetical protein n=1 Tax=unclassified Paenibacillus TaxID=185978 RepID=UPI0024065012|nr:MULTISPECIES: hypothetical protein [unclassified Paenibacillus]MDF9845169.1 hypothetical protein [Paenibacillus sp. PastF-2]MDF9850339.1 hypothetical protein [Paenibacillus sp. PastM-2]MDF9856958.1 hypothetical protein [Paenibacillus sp. PastF-1]MDH6482185.1 hypothetical protein [Paenibacillus sp. PastH-2]MDH6509651.1 hypothetical protein [Paenibacillus sp. PastM-3]
MHPISNIFTEYLRRHDQEFHVKATVNGEEYTDSQIVDFSVEDRLTLSDGFEIGTAIPSKLLFRIRAAEELPANAQIIPYVALSLANMTWMEADIAWEDNPFPWTGGATEWLPMGEFYIDSRDKVNDVWEYTCYDKLVYADQPYISSLTYPTTQQAVFDELCSRLGYVSDSSVAINPTYTVPVAPSGFSMRQVLGYIAGANCASLFMGRDGKLKMKRFVPNEQPVFDLGMADYIRARQTNPLKSYSRVVVTYDTEDNLTYESGSGDENHTLTLENPLITQAMADALCASLSGVSYLPLTMDAKGYPQLERGDRIGVGLYEGTSWMETITPWNATEIPWTGVVQYQSYVLHQVFSFKGGLLMSIESPSVSEQQSEFKVPGTLSEAVDNLDRTAVKEGKYYYGTTITRFAGIKVQRSDGKSDLTLNSDIMDWRVDGVSQLYYDALANRIKFSGRLEAAEGVFTGKLQGGEIEIGSGDNVFKANDWGFWSGDQTYADAPFKVDMTGHMTATDAFIQGTIQSSEILASTFTAGQIQTAEDGVYPRAEMSSTNRMFSVRTSSSIGIDMRSLGASSLTDLHFTNGSTYAYMSLPNSGLYLNGNASLMMEFANIYLRGYNGSYVSKWSDFRSEETGSSLQSELNTLVSLITSAAINMTFDPTTRNLKLFSMAGTQLAIVNIPQ